MLTVAASGNRSFCNIIRKGAIQSMEDSAVTFAETEYRPRRIGSDDIKAKSPSVEAQPQVRGRLKRKISIQETELQDVTAQLSGERACSAVASRSVYSENV